MSLRRIDRGGEGAVLRLPRRERQLLAHLAAELHARLAGDLDANDLRRLAPPAYEEEPAGEAEYQRMMRGELLEGRRRALRSFEATLESESLSRAELETWLTVLNDLRLVLGTRLDVTEELHGHWPDPRDPRAPELAVYVYLSGLQEEAVDAAHGVRFGDPD